MPEAVALSVFGAIAALAMLVLVGQGLIQLISRSAVPLTTRGYSSAGRASGLQPEGQGFESP
jgi:hypothetical protein